MSYNWNDRHRQTVQDGRQTLQRITASLDRTHRIAIETEDIVHQVVNELDEQRESLLRSQRRLGEANSNLSRSGAIVRSMKRNVVFNRLILLVIIILEIIALVALLFSKLRKR